MSTARRVAAYESWYATQDRTARTAPARKAANDRFERQAAEDARAQGRTLSPEERAKQAELLRKIPFIRLGLRSAAVRRARSLRARLPQDGET